MKGAPSKPAGDYKENRTVRASDNEIDLLKEFGFESLQDFVNKKMHELKNKKQVELLKKELEKK